MPARREVGFAVALALAAPAFAQSSMRGLGVIAFDSALVGATDFVEIAGHGPRTTARRSSS